MASLTLTAQDLISYLCKMHVSLQYRVMNYGVLSVPMKHPYIRFISSLGCIYHLYNVNGSCTVFFKKWQEYTCSVQIRFPLAKIFLFVFKTGSNELASTHHWLKMTPNFWFSFLCLPRLGVQACPTMLCWNQTQGFVHVQTLYQLSHMLLTL